MPDFLDHIDINSKNDKIENLRPCTKRQNNCNVGPKSKKASKYKGVNKNRNSWTVMINYDGKNHYIKSFKCEIQAALRYNKEAVKRHGEFAYLNIIHLL